MNQKLNKNCSLSKNLQHVNVNINNKPTWTATQLGIDPIFKNIIEQFDKVEFDIIKKNDELGTIEVNGCFFKFSKSQCKKYVITNFKTLKIRNSEQVDNYLQKIPNEIATKFRNWLPPFTNNQKVDEKSLGIDLPLNDLKIAIIITVIENRKEGNLKVNIRLTKGQANKSKQITINNFKSLDQQNNDDVLEIKQQFDQLQKSKTKLLHENIDKFQLKSYSKEELGFVDEPRNLNSVKIKSYTVKAIDFDGFLLIAVVLQKGQAHHSSFFKLEGFASPNKKINQEFEKIKTYLETLQGDNAFHLGDVNYSSKNWAYIWDMIVSELINRKKFDPLIVNKIQWLPTNHNKRILSKWTFLEEEFENSNGLVSCYFEIWIKDNQRYHIQISFKNYLKNQKMMEKHLNDWKLKKKGLRLQVSEESQWKNKNVLDFIKEKNIASQKLISWKTFLSWRLTKYNPFQYALDDHYFNITIYISLSTQMNASGKCIFKIYMAKNNYYYDKEPMMVIEGFKKY